MRCGAVADITDRNFTSAALILGVLKGMCDELYAFFCDMHIDRDVQVIASGGAVRRTAVLARILQDTFKRNVSISAVQEEAALGASLFAALCAHKLETAHDFADFIHYV